MVRQRLMRKSDHATNVSTNTKSSHTDEIPPRFFLEIATDDRKCLVVTCNPPLPDCTQRKHFRQTIARAQIGSSNDSLTQLAILFIFLVFTHVNVVLQSRFVNISYRVSTVAPVARESRFAASTRSARCIGTLCYPTRAAIIPISLLHGGTWQRKRTAFIGSRIRAIACVYVLS